MQIERLRLVGFKSFADPVEVTIGPGLTGIVGPNGCGKSNLAEALRWVMGESSARRLRGGAIDDVIFAGSAGRAPRNLAEVALTIDNHARDAPFAFNDREEIEIVRRAERGGGSSWRLNGREVRARDVQLLFADAATGKGSGSFVSQGRVAELIELKPAERRFLLEEAAGTAGVQARRRETELRLAAAEQNLARLDDVIAALAAQLAALQRQARQAQRYRRLGEQIRRHEALLFYGRWRAAAAEAQTRAAELAAAEAAVRTAEQAAVAERQASDNAEAALPNLRRVAAERDTELRRLTQARAALEQELARTVAARRDIERQLAELGGDRARALAQLAEADAALARLSAEADTLATDETASAEHEAAAERRLHEAAARLAEAEARLLRATEGAAQAQAQRAALDRRQREIGAACRQHETRLAEAEARRSALAAAAVSTVERQTATLALSAAERRVTEARDALDRSQGELAQKRKEERAAAEIARRMAAELARLEAEAQALEAIVAPPAETPHGTPVWTMLAVAPGFEAAIGGLFDDELSAVVDAGEEAGIGWRELPALAAPALPEGARPLTGIVTAPPALQRSLAFAGWVEHGVDGAAVQASLLPGQRIVDTAGRQWRWDGFTRPAGTSAAAQQLRHRNRLAALVREIAAARMAAENAESEHATLAAAVADATETERRLRLQVQEAETALSRARAAESELARRALTAETRLEAAADTVAKLTADLAAAQQEAAEIARRLAELPQATPVAATLEEARAAVGRARAAETEAQAGISQLRQESRFRRERLTAIQRETVAWRERRDQAAAQHATLDERCRRLEAELAALAERPSAIAEESEKLTSLIVAAAAAAREASERLEAGEAGRRETATRAQQAERVRAEARERRARAEVEAAATATEAALVRNIFERLAAAPAELGAIAGLTAGEAPPDPAVSGERIERLNRERAALGAVNLVAETEAAALAAKVEDYRRERAELTEAISKLRRAAQALDHQARELIDAAFERLNGHFGRLFVRLFDGGKAELKLTDEGDPLCAGLEIMASPSGKRLQSLSLLSGGEQALTALALIFAVFLTKPAPVCVLDEVDAPLDDANVDRLCGLVAEIADLTGTRFLLITHHRITMARADRLFGVTMVEHGVSQLVSVDLGAAAELRQSA